jgi:hypothetical protein
VFSPARSPTQALKLSLITPTLATSLPFFRNSKQAHLNLLSYFGFEKIIKLKK